MSTLSSHILDTATGRPASDLLAILSVQTETGWRELSRIATNEDGRIGWQHPDESGFGPATYQLRFDTAAYFKRTDVDGFYPYVDVVFTIAASDEHYHVPLLISPFGYSTYRGS